MISIDCEQFRLRRFVEQLAAAGDVDIHPDPIDLVDMSRIIEASDKASLFRQAGPQGQEIVGGVIGHRRRLAAAFGTPESNLVAEYDKRLANPQKVVEIASADAPVHAVITTGEDVDLTSLPFHLQHECDGGTYISASIDYSVDPANGKRNVGCRRLMLRGRRTMRSNLSQPSDFKRIYMGCVARGERFPVSFAIGSHPLDYLAATLRLPGDEFALVGTMRGAPVPMVRGVTNDILVPADAELVIEGYFDELGYSELEGPFGEFWGYYGPLHIDPVFHATAITRRSDVLHQTFLHGGRNIARMEMTALAMLQYESAIRRVLRGINIDPAGINVVAAAAPRHHVRVALRRGVAGQARSVISALFAMTGVKHVVVVDDDIDVFNDQEVEWAISTRFRPDQDMIVTSGMPGYYTDPTAAADHTISKVGFDATAPYGRPASIDSRRPLPPRLPRTNARFATVTEALAEAPKFFSQIMQELGSRDGRDISLELDALRAAGRLTRRDDGAWIIDAPAASGQHP